MNWDDLIELMPSDPFKDKEHLRKDFEKYYQEKEKLSMSNKVGHQDVTDFTKLLVEIGGVFKVDEEFYIRNATKDERILVTDKNKEDVPIKIYHNNRLPGDYHVLNLFKETRILKPEHAWFFHEICDNVIAMHMFLIIDEIIDLLIEKTDNDKLLKLNDYIVLSGKEDPTEKTKKELRSIDKKYFLNMFYDTQKKIGEIQSALMDEEVVTKYKSISKRTWNLIKDIYSSLFNGNPNEIQDMFVYSASTINAPQCETHIMLLMRFYDQIKDIVALLDIPTVNMEDFKEHCRLIEAYQRMAAWDDGIRSRNQKMIQPDVGTPSNSFNTSPTRTGGVPDLNPVKVPDFSTPSLTFAKSNTNVPNFNERFEAPSITGSFNSFSSPSFNDPFYAPNTGKVPNV